MQSIVNTLILNTSFIENLGLLNGKMGVAICFFHLAKESNNKVYTNYANQLIDEICEEINNTPTIDFINGLAGIGFGIEFLVQNSFIYADTDEVLAEIDDILELKSKNITSLKDIIGIGLYFLWRLKKTNTTNNNVKTIIVKQVLIQIIKELYKKIYNSNKLILRYYTKSKNLLNNEFDITWIYPILIWFLTELHSFNISNSKVRNMINILILPLLDKSNWPLSQSNCLLLGLSIKNLHKNVKNPNINLISTIASELIEKFYNESIKTELNVNNFSIKKGSAGISFIYANLYLLTQNNRYLKEYKYWNKQSLLRLKKYKLDSSKTPLGILDGVAGILWNNVYF